MSSVQSKLPVYVSIAVAATVGCLLSTGVLAADDPRVASTTSHTDGRIPYVGQGEDAAAMRRAVARGITKYEDEAQEGGGGAAQKTLIDNDVVKVVLAAYKKGFDRPGGMKRRYDTLLVYIDQGGYSGGQYKPGQLHLAPGSSVFHRKDSIVSPIHIDQDYRVLYVEMKRPTQSAGIAKNNPLALLAAQLAQQESK